jgi:hypothetical protein
MICRMSLRRLRPTGLRRSSSGSSTSHRASLKSLSYRLDISTAPFFEVHSQALTSILNPKKTEFLNRFSDLLDAALQTKYARNPDKLRAWQSASHIERAPQREKKPAPANPPK